MREIRRLVLDHTGIFPRDYVVPLLSAEYRYQGPPFDCCGAALTNEALRSRATSKPSRDQLTSFLRRPFDLLAQAELGDPIDDAEVHVLGDHLRLFVRRRLSCLILRRVAMGEELLGDLVVERLPSRIVVHPAEELIMRVLCKRPELSLVRIYL